MTLQKKIKQLKKSLTNKDSSVSEEIDDDPEEITEVIKAIFSKLRNAMFVLVEVLRLGA